MDIIIIVIFVAVVLLTLFCLFLKFKNKLMKRRLIKKYDKEKDLSRLGEARKEGLGRISADQRVARIPDSKPISPGQIELERQKLLQAATPSDDTESESGTGEDSPASVDTPEDPRPTRKFKLRRRAKK